MLRDRVMYIVDRAVKQHSTPSVSFHMRSESCLLYGMLRPVNEGVWEGLAGGRPGTSASAQ